MALCIIAFLLFLICALLFKAVRALPIYELRRLAQSGKGGMQSIYKAASYGKTLDITLWLAASVFLSWSLVSAADINPWAIIAIAFLATFTITFLKLPPRPQGFVWLIASVTAVPAAMAAALLHPATGFLFRAHSPGKGSGLFEKQDLVNLIKSQKNLPGNRISAKDLQVVEAALRFSGKAVSEVMATGAKQCFVSGNEPIGPLLMDELHSRGRFAYLITKGQVRKQDAKPVGTLFLRDLVGHQISGKVRDVAQEQVYYINESQPIGDALEAMLKTQFPILAVINNFEEVAGVVSLEDIIKQLLPDFMESEFENYANPKAVAGWQPDSTAKTEQHTVSSKKSAN